MVFLSCNTQGRANWFVMKKGRVTTPRGRDTNGNESPAMSGFLHFCVACEALRSKTTQNAEKTRNCGA
jgi:hypothetical protein